MKIIKNILQFRLRNAVMTTASMTYFGGGFLAIVFVATLIKWPGSFPSYVLLSLAFNWLLFDALKKKYSAGYVFLALVMWIGFWLKFSMHAVFSTVWMEPIGNFDFSVEQVNTVSIVASIGAFGVMLAGKLFGAIAGKPDAQRPPACGIDNRYFWWIGLSAVAVMSVLNEVFHIVQAFRPPPDLNLPFRLQGLVAWYLGGGWGILLMIPFYKSFCARRDISSIVLLVLAGVVISTTVYSRGTLVYQALIILLPMLVYREFLPKITFKKLAGYCLIIFFGVCCSVIVSMERRSNYLISVAPESATSWSSGNWFYIARLPIDRWIGLEGLMAVTAFDGKSPSFFAQRMLEERVLGKVDFYTHHIALHPATDTKTINYATPPGFLAFFYYTGSKWFVGILSLLLASFLIASERAVLFLSRNPFLATAIGVGLTVQIIHIGMGGIAAPLKIFATSLAVALFIGWFERLRESRHQARIAG